ncbi:hypothetical protein BAC2_03580 [uncultured bacterium]|nr:hypothetical protein BAC2_03580 [uncultured bacterium]
MKEYPVLRRLDHDRQMYEAGDTVGLGEDDAKRLQACVPPAIGLAILDKPEQAKENGGDEGQAIRPAQPQAETNTNGKDDLNSKDAGGGEDGTAQDVPGQPQTNKADAPATKPAKPKKG